MNNPVEITKKQSLLAIFWLPIHYAILLELLFWFEDIGVIKDDARLNFVRYAIGAVYMIAVLYKYMRKDFDFVCDSPLQCFFQVVGSYMCMLGLNAIIGMILLKVSGEINPNNNAVVEMAEVNSGVVTATAVFLAPIVEEMIFRAGIFGIIRPKSKVWAYAVSIVLFSLYHVLSYALQNPIYLIYAVQYIPASFLLCRCYEKTGSVWTSIFMHMLVNGVSMGVIGAL